MINPVQIRSASKHDARNLSSLAFRSQAHWSYSPEFMTAATEELSVSTSDIENESYHCFVAIKNSCIAGFYSLEQQSVNDIELGAMFVDPKFIGTGKGRDLSRPVYRYRSGRDKSCPYDEIAIYTSTFKIHSLGNGLTKVGTFVDLPLESFD